MERRTFLSSSLFFAQQEPTAREVEAGGTASTSYQTPITIERPQPGKPHRGRMLAAIQPHCDDIAIFAAGTVLKLIDEGYRGVLITLSDDSMAGKGSSIGDIVLKNERDTVEVAKRLGLEKSYFLNYPNHNMDAWPVIEIRARLIFLFRLLKVDTVFVYDPSALYERNPDHYVTARAVESACWMAASEWDYPEHFEAGLQPQVIRDKYYFARGPQLVNRVVDITPYFEKKIFVNLANVTQGPAGNQGAELRKKLAAQGKRLPLLGNDDETANREYTRHFALARDRARGQAHGLGYAEYFHHIGPDESLVEEYVQKYAVSL
ncbi:MAG: PIG-L family deacetylase [Bryobacteraceae bacterium]|nr:PIG-L family deacetylase [Bryobacteraceae bacterium]MDW8378676.1 PIG-L family deacetylase [Bryobacterales bacterium]